MQKIGSHLTVDGFYGPQTAGVARALQVRRHLTVDGLIGPKTWASGLGLTGRRPASGSSVSRPRGSQSRWRPRPGDRVGRRDADPAQRLGRARARLQVAVQGEHQPSGRAVGDRDCGAHHGRCAGESSAAPRPSNSSPGCTDGTPDSQADRITSRGARRSRNKSNPVNGPSARSQRREQRAVGPEHAVRGDMGHGRHRPSLQAGSTVARRPVEAHGTGIHPGQRPNLGGRTGQPGPPASARTTADGPGRPPALRLQPEGGGRAHRHRRGEARVGNVDHGSACRVRVGTMTAGRSSEQSGDRPEQQDIQPLGPRCDQCRRGGGRSIRCRPQRMSQRVHPVIELGGAGQQYQPGRKVGGGDHGTQIAVGRHVLDQHPIAERDAQCGHPEWRRAGRPWRREGACAVPHGSFQLGDVAPAGTGGLAQPPASSASTGSAVGVAGSRSPVARHRSAHSSTPDGSPPATPARGRNGRVRRRARPPSPAAPGRRAPP